MKEKGSCSLPSKVTGHIWHALFFVFERCIRGLAGFVMENNYLSKGGRKREKSESKM